MTQCDSVNVALSNLQFVKLKSATKYWYKSTFKDTMRLVFAKVIRSSRL